MAQGNLKQQSYFKSAFLTMDPTLVQENNSMLYFRNMQGPRDSSNNQYYDYSSTLQNGGNTNSVTGQYSPSSCWYGSAASKKRFRWRKIIELFYF